MSLCVNDETRGRKCREKETVREREKKRTNGVILRDAHKDEEKTEHYSEQQQL